jgi:hypothetical protein
LSLGRTRRDKRARARTGSIEAISTLIGRPNYGGVVSQRLDEPTPGRNLLEEFFAESDEPRSSHSSFTPEQVAEIVRRDRNASE